jgi:hypothetical protein
VWNMTAPPFSPCTTAPESKPVKSCVRFRRKRDRSRDDVQAPAVRSNFAGRPCLLRPRGESGDALVFPS